MKVMWNAPEYTPRPERALQTVGAPERHGFIRRCDQPEFAWERTRLGARVFA
jgi:hypothetical protein